MRVGERRVYTNQHLKMAKVMWILALVACISVTYVSSTINECQFFAFANTINQACYDGSDCSVYGTTPSTHNCTNGQVCCIGTASCVNQDCSSNGVCSNDICTCNPGFDGTDCEIDVCASNPCAVGASCVGETTAPYYSCACPAGFTGTLCDVDACLSNGPCVNGTCTPAVSPEGFTCLCETGFSDPLCSTDVCTGDPCGVNGNCVREVAPDFNCVCTGIYIGDFCNETTCTVGPCANSAPCTPLTDTTYECACLLNTTGLQCDQPVCSGSGIECTSQGECVPQPDATTSCTCDPGFTGPTCSDVEPLCGIEPPTARLLNHDVDVESGSPWLVRLTWSIDGNITQCMGVLISHQFILTDTLCLAFCSAVGGCEVRIGDYQRTVIDTNEVGQGVDIFSFHPDSVAESLGASGFIDALFSGATTLDLSLNNNVAIAKLSAPVSYGPNVNKPCPPKGLDAYKCGAECKVASFGVDAEGSSAIIQDFRQTLEAQLLEDDVCRFLRKKTDTPVAGGCGFFVKPDTGTCTYDNGAALVCMDPDTNAYTLEGIIGYRPAYNYGSNSADCSNQVFVYTDVQDVWSWVETEMAAMSI